MSHLPRTPLTLIDQASVQTRWTNHAKLKIFSEFIERWQLTEEFSIYVGDLARESNPIGGMAVPVPATFVACGHEVVCDISRYLERADDSVISSLICGGWSMGGVLNEVLALTRFWHLELALFLEEWDEESVTCRVDAMAAHAWVLSRRPGLAHLVNGL